MKEKKCKFAHPHTTQEEIKTLLCDMLEDFFFFL